VSAIDAQTDAVLPPYTKEKAVELAKWFAASDASLALTHK